MLQNKSISYLYNPATQTKEQLIDNFVARQKEFKRIMRDIKNSKVDEVSQNFLITAQRGMGKTTLLLRLEYEVNSLPELSHLIPIRFSEEQYNIVSFCNLWEVVADLLDEQEGFTGIAEQIDQAIGEDTDNCFDVIQEALKQNGKKLLLLMDNFQDILKKFRENEVKALRDILHGTELQIITASSLAIDNTYKHDKPFFEFFKIINLEGLNSKDTENLFNTLIKLHGDENETYDSSRIEIIKRLTGGVPRTMMIIFEILINEENTDIFEDLEYILDQVTTLYKHRMDDLSPDSQRIAHEIAMAWDGITFEELKKKTRTTEDELKVYLLELEKSYFIESEHICSKVNIYQLKERFFNIWYLMRNGRNKNKDHIKWLVKFLDVWCTPAELKDRAYQHIEMVQNGEMNLSGAFYMGEALAYMVEDETLEYQVLFETKEYLKIKNSSLAEQVLIKEKSMNNIDHNSNNIQDYLEISDVYRTEKKYSLAIQYLQKVILIDSKDVRPYNNIGYIYSELKEYDKAIKYFKKAISIYPKGIQAYNNIGYVYNALKEYDNAIKYFEKAISIYPKDIQAYNNIGYIYRDLKEYDNAIKYFEKAISIYPKDIQAYNNIGYIYRDLKEYDNAIKYFKKVKFRYPKNLQVYNNIGYVYKDLKEYNNAIKYFKKAINVYPKDIQAYNNIGYIYRNLKEYDKAIEYFEKAIEIHPKGTQAYNNIAYIYRNLKEYDKAIEYFEKAIEIHPKDTQAYNDIGLRYCDLKEYDKAIEYFEKAIEIHPKDIQAYNNIGLTYCDLKEYDKAIEYFEKAILNAPQSNGGYFNLALLYYSLAIEKEKSLNLSWEATKYGFRIDSVILNATCLLWNENYYKSIKNIENVLDKYKYLKFFTQITEYFLLLISKKQIKSLYELFTKHSKLKSEFKPVYYTLMYFMQDEYPTEYKRMGSELKESVQEMIDEVGRLEEKYS
ncbi:MAG: Unknown protein [uncultured Sulfurovum sp.]|uniref:beta-lactamase n=1 Tax=uncultured Sulfurovum sp. TaxID=269237 RepID=A0A6S6SL99_9BACT|nr:MAG: Unknown protein [uncultured Sulfurovum sp.]